MLGPFVHVFLMPYFMMKKQKHSAREAELSGSMRESAVLDDGAKTRIFAIKFTFCQSIIVATVGFVIGWTGKGIKIAKMFGLDLSCFFFPMPFYEFWKARLK